MKVLVEAVYSVLICSLRGWTSTHRLPSSLSRAGTLTTVSAALRDSSCLKRRPWGVDRHRGDPSPCLLSPTFTDCSGASTFRRVCWKIILTGSLNCCFTGMITGAVTSSPSRSRTNWLKESHMWLGFVWKRVSNRSRTWFSVGLVTTWLRSELNRCHAAYFGSVTSNQLCPISLGGRWSCRDKSWWISHLPSC